MVPQTAVENLTHGLGVYPCAPLLPPVGLTVFFWRRTPATPAGVRACQSWCRARGVLGFVCGRTDLGRRGAYYVLHVCIGNQGANTMNRNTPHAMRFVLYSIHELVASDGAGFWSNDEGWVEFKAATRFTLASVPSCNLPITPGQDAKWIMWVPTGAPGVSEPQALNSLAISTH